MNIHNDERILKNFSVLSQGWHDFQQGKTFVHIPGMVVSSFSRLLLGLFPKQRFVVGGGSLSRASVDFDSPKQNCGLKAQSVLQQ